MFVVPVSLKDKEFILSWEDTSDLPWGILILFGGGLCLARGMEISGIIEVIGSTIASYANIDVWVVVILLTGTVLFMTELMSNVALVAVLAPVVAGIAIGLDIPMLHLLIPVTIASSCAFMLPMATPPNAIVFASGYIRVHQMARVGFVLNCISILLLLAVFQFVVPLLF